MQLRNELEREHSIRQSRKIVDHIGSDPGRFKSLIEIFLEGPYRITQRASWPLSHCVETHPHLIRPHLKRLLDHLKQPGIHDAAKRNTIRLLQFIDIPNNLEGTIAQICFDYLADRKQPIAVRVFSMTVLGKIAGRNPDLKGELKMLIEDELPFASAAFRSRARKVLRDGEDDRKLRPPKEKG